MKALFATCVLVCALLCNAQIVCRDENGSPVDWWVILKVPHLEDSSDQPARTGYAYAYADKNNAILQYNGLVFNKGVGALHNTLNQIYLNSDNNSVAWVMYDDESPDSVNHEDFGHTKGDLAFDAVSGFWLGKNNKTQLEGITCVDFNVPRFPNVPDGNPYPGYPKRETSFGQSFLCVSYGSKTFNKIGQQLQINKAYIFASAISPSLSQIAPSIAAAINGDETSQNESQVITLKSLGGNRFVSFGKSKECNCDLYSQVVQPYYQAGMYIETWMDGAEENKMPSYCTPQYPYDSINVVKVSVASGVSWDETKDHSKWGVTMQTSGSTVWCIGDINRQFSQAQRGGGTVCSDNSSVYKSLRKLIASADTC